MEMSAMNNYFAEPFKIKMVEPIKILTKEERLEKIKRLTTMSLLLMQRMFTLIF